MAYARPAKITWNILRNCTKCSIPSSDLTFLGLIVFTFWFRARQRYYQLTASFHLPGTWYLVLLSPSNVANVSDILKKCLVHENKTTLKCSSMQSLRETTTKHVSSFQLKITNMDRESAWPIQQLIGVGQPSSKAHTFSLKAAFYGIQSSLTYRAPIILRGTIVNRTKCCE